jgi:Polyketide cyclase / dehydrase and lipid transport
MVSSKDRAFINAPVDAVWRLAADPDRQTEWWPDTIEFECEGESFEQGCKVRNVQSRPWPMGDLTTTLEVATMNEGRELLVKCTDTGTFTRAVLTEAQGGTYIECEAGNDPMSMQYKLIDATVGRRLFRRWVEHALDRLRVVAEAEGAATPKS